jgi:hypothetical protein
MGRHTLLHRSLARTTEELEVLRKAEFQARGFSGLHPPGSPCEQGLYWTSQQTFVEQREKHALDYHVRSLATTLRIADAVMKLLV